MGAKLGGGTQGRFDMGQNAEMNVTPFVDVMLVLLIIFMVAAPMATLAVKVDLPPVLEDKRPLKAPTLVSIEPGGAITVSGRPTSLANLGGELARALAVPVPQNENVLIRADTEVSYADFMAVVNQLQADGFYKVALFSEATA